MCWVTPPLLPSGPAGPSTSFWSASASASATVLPSSQRAPTGPETTSSSSRPLQAPSSSDSSRRRSSRWRARWACARCWSCWTPRRRSLRTPTAISSSSTTASSSCSLTTSVPVCCEPSATASCRWSSSSSHRCSMSSSTSGSSPCWAWGWPVRAWPRSSRRECRWCSASCTSSAVPGCSCPRKSTSMWAAASTGSCSARASRWAS